MPEDKDFLWSELSRTLSASQLEYYWGMISRFLQGPSKVENWDSIMTPEAKYLPDISSLRYPKTSQTECQLSKLVIGKLNGGMGTSMGCLGPKS